MYQATADVTALHRPAYYARPYTYNSHPTMPSASPSEFGSEQPAQAHLWGPGNIAPSQPLIAAPTPPPLPPHRFNRDPRAPYHYPAARALDVDMIGWPHVAEGDATSTRVPLAAYPRRPNFRRDPLVRVEDQIEWVRQDVLKLTLLLNFSPNADAEAHGPWGPESPRAPSHCCRPVPFCHVMFHLPLCTPKSATLLYAYLTISVPTYRVLWYIDACPSRELMRRHHPQIYPLSPRSWSTGDHVSWSWELVGDTLIRTKAHHTRRRGSRNRLYHQFTPPDNRPHPGYLQRGYEPTWGLRCHDERGGTACLCCDEGTRHENGLRTVGKARRPPIPSSQVAGRRNYRSTVSERGSLASTTHFIQHACPGEGVRREAQARFLSGVGAPKVPTRARERQREIEAGGNNLSTRSCDPRDRGATGTGGKVVSRRGWIEWRRSSASPSQRWTSIPRQPSGWKQIVLGFAEVR
ncbi:hypothetical protein EDB87DRAFT_1576970 [Lactarius vividus]|nr:hypothetical protein EDB87DRAFT_1576970 [Lactarius vividus]